MKKYSAIILGMIIILISACSSSKNSTDLSATRDHLKGDWEITDIQVNLPAGFTVSNVFDAAPYSDFQNSMWHLVRNGKGSYTLENGTTQDIYWSSSKEGVNGQFKFKKIMAGEKARKVDEGYVLNIQNLSSNGFTAVSDVKLSEGKTGTITYTFTKK